MWANCWADSMASCGYYESTYNTYDIALNSTLYFLNMLLQRKVLVHVTFLRLGEINTLKEQFDADVLIRTKWREPTLDGYKHQVSNKPKINLSLLYTLHFTLSYKSLGI